jgi:hypothetical protein
MRAGRLYAVRRRRQDLDQQSLVERSPTLEYPQPNALAGQRSLDEYGLALVTRDTAAVVRKIHDLGLPNLAGLQLGSHAAENSR